MTLQSPATKLLQNDPHRAISKAQKAAIILANLSSETAKSIVEDISDAHLMAFARALGELKPIPPALLQVIAREFVAEVEQTASDLNGGIDEARKILTTITEEERANRILTELSNGDGDSIWRRLEMIDDNLIVDYISKQRAAVSGIILSQLTFEKAASVLAATPTQSAQFILAEISRRGATNADVVTAIGAAVNDEFLKPLSDKPSVDNASATLAEIVSFLPGAKRDEFLAHLDETDPPVAAAVRRSVISFEDLCNRLPEAGAAAVLREVDKSLLLKALKHGQSNASETVAFLLANVSKRMAEQYAVDIAEMPDISEADGEAAQRKIIKVVKSLAKSGEYALTSP